MKTLILLWSLLNQFSFVARTYEIVRENQIIQNNIDYVNEINNYADITYESLIAPSTSYMYYGRILKYYYANSVTIDSNDITSLESYINVSGSSTNAAMYKELVIQNLIASTLMPSIYGSSSDAEFFAESFSKWLNTDDSLKNKSWEVTNDFYTKVLPTLIQVGGPYTGNYDSSTTINAKAVEIVSSLTGTSTYDTTLSSKVSGALDLQYTNDAIIWTTSTSTSNALTYIASQVRTQSSLTVTYSNTSQIVSILSSWMYDSYTPATTESIESFNTFNTNHYDTFDALDTQLKEASVDVNGDSLIQLANTFDSVENTYLSTTPNVGLDYEVWTSAQTTALKALTLKMYNALYNIIQNETLVNTMLAGLVISPDYPLSGTSSGTMGYTSTAHYTLANNFVSTVYSYIVISGPSLTFKEFNDQYLAGFWSSPYKFSVWVHEMGHVVDAFGSKTSQYRAYKNTNYANLTYSSMYSGNVFLNSGDDTDTSTGGGSGTTTAAGAGIKSTWVYVGIVAVAGTVILSGIIALILAKKIKSDDD